MSGYGSTFTSTPNLDRIGSEGVFFDRAYCANPVCTPARASLFSGLYPSRHGAWNIGTNVSNNAPMLSHRLAASGYATAYVGKMHFQAYGGGDRSKEGQGDWDHGAPESWSTPYYGFQTVKLAIGHVTYGMRGHYGSWLARRLSKEERDSIREGASPRCSGPAFGGEAYDWNMPLELHNSVWTADESINFLRSHDANQPFFLAIGFQDPHHPHAVPADFTDRVSPADVPLPDQVPDELDDKPPHFALAHRGSLEGSPYRGEYYVGGQGPGFDYAAAQEEDVRLGRAYYYTMVRLIDREVGRILASLDELGLAENTIVVFTTDHGELLGDHGLWLKGPFLYEQLVRVPMMMRWPATVPAGGRIGSTVSHVDIVPTILEAVGVQVRTDDSGRAHSLDGESLLPLLREQDERTAPVFVECVDDPQKLRLKSIVTDRYKLVHYHGQPFGELYDLEDDPREKKNLFHDSRHGEVKAALLAGLMDHTEQLERRTDRISYA